MTNIGLGHSILEQGTVVIVRVQLPMTQQAESFHGRPTGHTEWEVALIAILNVQGQVQLIHRHPQKTQRDDEEEDTDEVSSFLSKNRGDSHSHNSKGQWPKIKGQMKK